MRSILLLVLAVPVLAILTGCAGIDTTMLGTAATRDTLGIGISLYKGGCTLPPIVTEDMSKDISLTQIEHNLKSLTRGVNGINLDIPLRSSTDMVIRLFDTGLGSSFGARLGFKQQLTNKPPLASDSLSQNWVRALVPSAQISFSPGNTKNPVLPRLLAGFECQYLNSLKIQKAIIFTWGVRGNYTFARYIEPEQIDSHILHGGVNMNWCVYSGKFKITTGLGVDLFVPIDAENWSLYPSISISVGWQ